MDRSRKQKQPSFSSTLLDVIYRETENEHTKTTKNRHSIDASKNIRDAVTGSIHCSEFSSSEAERIYGFPTRLKPLRTSINEDGELDTKKINRSMCQKPKAKSRVMRIYSYIKKGTHPVSPGGRLARFLTSLLSTTNTKKSKSGGDKIVHADRISKLSVINVSTPSAACSFSRMCLNQTPSNARFYPASVKNIIVDERRGDRSDNSSRHVEESGLKNYQKKVERVFDSIKNNDDEDETASSYASSDLFELDHLSTIGIDPCIQELPLYETTSVDANRAIANGLL